MINLHRLNIGSIEQATLVAIAKSGIIQQLIHRLTVITTTIKKKKTRAITDMQKLNNESILFIFNKMLPLFNF